MKRRHMILINLIFIGLMCFSAGTVYQFMTGTKPLSILASLGHHGNKAVVVKTTSCDTQKALPLGNATDPGLKKLAIYQQACHSFVTGTEMIFVSMPVDQATAVAYGKQDAAILKQYAQYGVRPLIIAEPTDQQGNNIDFGWFAAGNDTAAINTYFATIKAAGITDKQMGIWNPFPEANLPYWKNNLPEYFAPNINIYVGALRSVFPTAATSVMLNSATYSTTDFNWQNGEYDSLLPYVKGITPGLINYAGVQGFPWLAQAGGTGAIVNAAEFLSPDLLSEMADSLGTKNVWFNTGTFTTKYALDPQQIVTMTAQRRKAVLATVNDQALALKKEGYNVAVNIFAQNKSNDSEETDWSYWGAGGPFASESTPVITDFVNQLNTEHIPFWLFDR
ncbi:MAG: hypothetical protein ACQR33_06175 [Candidatus Saccharibacteria bacterium]